MENTAWWLNPGQLPDTYPAVLSRPLLNRTRGENKMEKLIGQAKDREITYQSLSRAKNSQLLPIKAKDYTSTSALPFSRSSFTPLPVQHSCPFLNVVRGITNFTDGLISCGLHWIHTSPIPHLPCPFL